MKFLFDRWTRFLVLSHDRPWLVLAAALLLTLLSAIPLPALKINTGLEALLPEESRSIAAVEELRSRVAGTDPLLLAVASDDAALNRRVVERLLEKVRTWPDTRVAFDRRDPSYLLERRLLLLPTTELASLADLLEERLEYERCARMPGCVNLEDEAPKIRGDEMTRRWRALPNVQALIQYFGDDFGDEVTSTSAAGPERAIDSSAIPTGSLCSDDGKVCALQAVLDGNPRDMPYAEGILRRCDLLFAEIRREMNLPEEVKIVADGIYRNAPMEKQQVQSDLNLTTWVSTILLVLVLAIQFRAIRSLLVLLLPTAIGIVWTLGVVAAFKVEMNIVSMFVLAILSGMGVDFGVHVTSFFNTARSEGNDADTALLRMGSELFPSMLAAAGTTIAGFFVLVTASFRGLSQLGPIAALGILLSLVAFALVAPPLLTLLDRHRPVAGGLVRDVRALRPPDYSLSTARIVTYVGAALAIVVGIWGFKLELETDFSKLEARHISHGVNLGAAFRGTSRSSIVLLGDSREALDAAVTDLQSRHDERVPLETALFLSPTTFFPTDVDDRLAEVERIEEASAALIRGSESPDANLVSLHDLAAGTTPLQLEHMPEWLKEQLIERDGTFGRLGLIFVSMRGAHADVMAELASAMEDWRDAHPHVAMSSSQAILGEIVPTLQNEAPRMMGLAVLGVIAVVSLLARSWKKALLVLVPLALTAGATLGAMVLLGLKLNMFNLLVVPVGFGIAIDGAIYVAWQPHTDGEDREKISTFRAVLFSTLTTLVAFGSLGVANHPGLASVGYTAMLAMGLSLVYNLYWLPAFLRVLRGVSSMSKADGAPAETQRGEAETESSSLSA